VVVPILSWYDPQFVGSRERTTMIGFDAACRQETERNLRERRQRLMRERERPTKKPQQTKERRKRDRDRD